MSRQALSFKYKKNTSVVLNLLWIAVTQTIPKEKWHYNLLKIFVCPALKTCILWFYLYVYTMRHFQAHLKESQSFRSRLKMVTRKMAM